MGTSTTTGSAEALFNLSADAVPGAIADVFMRRLMISPSVYDTFFSSTNTSGDLGPPLDGWADWLDSVAAALACSGISRTSEYDFSDTVNGTAADAYWGAELSGPHGLTVGQLIYDDVFGRACGDGQGGVFDDYLNNDPAGWAKQLADYLTTSHFINDVLDKLIASEPNWLDHVNLAYYKLHRLDPEQEAVVVSAWTKAYSGAVEQWQQDNHLAKLLSGNEWVGAVNTAIGVATIESYSKGLWGGEGTITTYGKAVQGFLTGKPSSLNLSTGNRPNNTVVE